MARVFRKRHTDTVSNSKTDGDFMMPPSFLNRLVVSAINIWAINSGTGSETAHKSVVGRSSEIHQTSDCYRVARGGLPRSAR